MSAAKSLPQPEHRSIKLSELRLDPDTQSRASIDQATVGDYRDAIAAGDDFGPIIVFHDGKAGWVGDGFHRVHAFRAAGRSEIAAVVHVGTKRDAILYAAGANGTHGLRRTNADKRRSVEMVLADAAGAGWSDRDIAKHCHVSHTFVSLVRRESRPQSGNVATPAPPAPPKAKPITRTIEDKSPDFGDDDFRQDDPDADEPENLLAEDSTAEAEGSAPAPEPFVVPSYPAKINHPTSLIEREPGEEDEPEDEKEWLATLPLNRILANEPQKLFRADARIYRRFLPTREEYRDPATEAFGNLSRKGAFGSTLARLLKASDPKHWHKCPPTNEGGCDGLGELPGIGEKCPMCFGRGYLLFAPGGRR